MNHDRKPKNQFKRLSNIILFSGKAEAGKTTAARMLKEFLDRNNYKSAIIPYGDYVKNTARLIFDWNGEKDKAGRYLLQHWGTDIVRKKDPNFWTDTVVRLASVLNGELDFIIIDDARFENEITCWAGEYWVYTVRVERPGYENHLTPEQRMHPSETSLDNYTFDALLHATNQGELYDEIIGMTTSTQFNCFVGLWNEGEF